MDIFFTLLIKLIPLYIMILLWFIAAKVLHAEKETVAKLLIYIIAPVVIFYGTYTAELQATVLLLPVFFFVLCSLIALLFLYVWRIFGDRNKLKNILAFTAGTGNIWYFWLPVVFAIFDESVFSIAVLCILWFVLYENTVGYYITSMGNYSPKQSLVKVLKLPTIYAFITGLVFNISWVELWATIAQNINYFKWAYTVLGMMIIGMWLSQIKKSSFHLSFLWLCFFAKFLFWPAIILTIIWLDKNFSYILWEDIHAIMLLMSIVPLAANTIAIATELDTHPEESTIAVFASTIFALFYIPFMVAIFL